MIIMCDMDNCLNDLVSKAIQLYNSRTKKSISLSDITTYGFADCLSEEDALGITELFKEKQLWDSLVPLPNSQKCLRTLVNQGHRVIIATATDPCNFEWKCQFMSKYFPFIPIDNIIRIVDKTLLKMDVMIEDCLDNLTSNICERICINYPWNNNEDKDYIYDIRRVKSWGEIVNVINEIERKNKEWEKR